MTWRKDDYTRDDTIVIYDENGGTVVIIRGDGRLTERQRRQADMIVAVPDLIEACEVAKRGYESAPRNTLGQDHDTGHYYRDEMISVLDAAIAKARGE